MSILSRIEFVTINVSDMKRSIQFYRDVLGFSVQSESPHRSVLDVGGSAKIALHKGVRRTELFEHTPLAGRASIGFSVENLDKAMEELKARGAIFESEPSPRGGGNSMVVELADPDGFQITIFGPSNSRH